MLGFLYRILIGNFKGCKHKWEILHQCRRTGDTPNTYSGLVYIQKCEHCGKIRKTEF